MTHFPTKIDNKCQLAELLYEKLQLRYCFSRAISVLHSFCLLTLSLGRLERMQAHAHNHQQAREFAGFGIGDDKQEAYVNCIRTWLKITNNYSLHTPLEASHAFMYDIFLMFILVFRINESNISVQNVSFFSHKTFLIIFHCHPMASLSFLFGLQFRERKISYFSYHTTN